MGNAVATTAPQDGSTPAPVSVGGRRHRRVFQKFTMSASYSTGGDTLAVPTGFGSLIDVRISNAFDGTRMFTWDGSTATPKVKATKLSAGAYAEETAATNLSAVVLGIEFLFEL